MKSISTTNEGYAEKNKKMLLKRYRGYYIAICNLKVVGKGKTIVDLYNNVPMRYHGMFLTKNCTSPNQYDF